LNRLNPVTLGHSQTKVGTVGQTFYFCSSSSVSNVEQSCSLCSPLKSSNLPLKLSDVLYRSVWIMSCISIKYI